jgi:hypothetical protein
MNANQANELLLQSLTHEKGGVLVYQTALKCVVNGELRDEWEKYLDETKTHVRILTDACDQLAIDTERPSPGCKIVEHLGNALVQATEKAPSAGDPDTAQLVACVLR